MEPSNKRQRLHRASLSYHRKENDDEPEKMFRQLLFQDSHVEQDILSRAREVAAVLLPKYWNLSDIPRSAIDLGGSSMQFLTIVAMCFISLDFEKNKYPRLCSYRNYSIRVCRQQCRDWANLMLETVCPHCKRPHESEV